MGDLCDRWSNNTRRNTTQMSENKTTEQKPALFEVLLSTIGTIAKEENLTLPEVLGHLELCKKSAIDQVVAFAEKQKQAASEPSEDGDKEKTEDASPEKAEA